MKEHLIRYSVRITCWNQMREEILEITRKQQYIDSQTIPMKLGANPQSKGKGKESEGKGKGKDVKSKDKAKDVRNESSKKVKSDDRKKCFYCNKTGHVRAECRKRLKDLAEAEGNRWQRRHFHTTQQQSCRYSAYSQAKDTRQRLSKPCLV